MPQTGLFPGWRIVFGSIVGVIFGASTMILQTIGVFILPLTAEFDVTRSAVTLAQVIAVHTLVLCSPLAGYLADRFSIRRVASCSAVLMGLSFASLALLSDSLTPLWWIYGLSAALGCCTTPIVFATIVSRWFDRRRGIALGLTLAGVGLGVTLLPLLAGAMVEHSGWRSAYLLLGGGAVLIAAPTMWFLFRDHPAELGLLPDGGSNASAAAPALRAATFSLRDALRTSAFWRLLVAFGAFGAAFGAVIVHLVPLLVDKGFGRPRAALMLSLVGLASIVGRVVTGYLLDRVAPSRLALVFLIPAAFAIGSLVFDTSLAACVLLVIVIGIANGAEVDILSYLAGRLFGLNSFGSIYGVLFGIFTLGGAWGGLLLAAGFDATGAYGTPLLVLAGGILAGCALLVSLPNHAPGLDAGS